MATAVAKANSTQQPFAPMLGKDAPKVRGEVILPTGQEWRIEKKLDGWRFMAHITDQGVKFWSGRNGIQRKGPALNEIAADLSFLPDDTVVDGELIVREDEGRSGLGGSPAVGHALANVGESLTYVVFDMLRVGGHDTVGHPWSVRRQYLDAVRDGFDGENVRASEVFSADPALHERWLAEGFEGSMAKKLDATYLPGKRSDAFLKVKPQDTAEAIVVGFVAGKGSLAGQVGAFEIRMLRTGAITSVGINNDVRRELREQGPESYLGKVVEIRHHGIREDSGKPRHPVWGFRRDDR